MPLCNSEVIELLDSEDEDFERSDSATDSPARMANALTSAIQQITQLLIITYIGKRALLDQLIHGLRCPCPRLLESAHLTDDSKTNADEKPAKSGCLTAESLKLESCSVHGCHIIDLHSVDIYDQCP